MLFLVTALATVVLGKTRPLLLSNSEYAFVAQDRGIIYTNHSGFQLSGGDWSRYKRLERVGKGKFSVVYRGLDKHTNQYVAMKYLIYPVEPDRILRELNVLKAAVGLQGVVQLLDFVIEPKTKTRVVVMNFINQGGSYKDLFETFNDWDIRHYMYEALKALDRLHSQGLIHRDLKPLNMVYDPQEMTFALCDLGTAEFYMPYEPLKTRLGTKQYKSPEYLLRKRDYDYAVDVWTMGVTMASLLTRRYPFFEAQSDEDQFMNIVRLFGTDVLFDMLEKYDLKLTTEQANVLNDTYYPETEFSTYVHSGNVELNSLDAHDLLKKLLAVDPEHRITAKAALDHPFFSPIRECWSALDVEGWPYDVPTESRASHSDSYTYST